MVPTSRDKRRGAYRDLMFNYINGTKDTEVIFPGRRNTVSSTLASFALLNLESFNHITLVKRRVSQERKTFTMESSVVAGDDNSIKVSYWSPEFRDYTASILAGSDNNVDIVLHEIDNISIGSGNHMRGKLSIAEGGTSIGNNNILIDFTPEIAEGSRVYGYPELSELMFETEVVSISSAGSKQIEVDDTSKIMLGGKIYFGTLGAAFADRIVTWVNGNFVGFDDPISSKEVTIVGSRVFNHYPETVEMFNSTLAENVDQGSKRIVVSDSGSLHLRNLTINGLFETKSFFQRSSDNMVIIRDATDLAYLAGTTVTSAGVYPYSEWNTACSLYSGSTYYVENAIDSAYIGRVIDISEVSYTIVGFSSDTITFDMTIPVGTTHLSFLSVDEAQGGGPSSTTLEANAAGNSLVIDTLDATGFFIGQTLRIGEIVKTFTVISIDGNTITLNIKIFGDTVNDSFYVGVVELPIDIAATKASIEAGAIDLNTYIFGGS